MPVLNTTREVKKIILKESSQPNDEAWVEVYQTLLAGDMIGMESYQDDQSMASIAVLAKLIKSWNFTDKDKTVLPINIETVRCLPMADMIQIIQETKALDTAKLTDIKKKL